MFDLLYVVLGMLYLMTIMFRIFFLLYVCMKFVIYFLFYRSLSDIDADGRLSCEEFVLAMHLVESVKAGDALPTVLPADLIPPSHRRKRSTSIQSGKFALYYFGSLEKYSQ